MLAKQLLDKKYKSRTTVCIRIYIASDHSTNLETPHNFKLVLMKD